MIQEGMGIALLTPAGAQEIARGDIDARPLSDKELHVGAHIACLADNRSRLLSEFVRAVGRSVSMFKDPPQLNLPIAG